MHIHKSQEAVYDKIYVPDTSVLIDEPDLITDLIKGGNLICIPWMVHKELTASKRGQRASRFAQRALKNINAYRDSGHPNLRLFNINWAGIQNYIPAKILDRTIADDEIIATALSVFKEYEKSDKPVILLTHDIGMQIKARELKFNGSFCLKVQEWNNDKGDTADQLKMPIIEIQRSVIKDKSIKGRLPMKIVDGVAIPENHGALIKTIDSIDSYISHVARRKGDDLILLDRELKLANIGQRPLPDGDSSVPNWEQILAINLLRELDIYYFTLVGLAGTGKTLLALASGLHFLLKNNRKFKKLYITRAPVSFGKTLGFLPGDMDEKMNPWVLGMLDNLAVIKDINRELNQFEVVKQIDFLFEGETGETTGGNGKEIKNGEKKEADKQRHNRKRIEILSFEHMRGRSLKDSIIIVDEVQNMTREQVITFASRLDEGTRLILTGDPTQIDIDFLTEERNGLVWFAKFMKGSPFFASIYFSKIIRSAAVRDFLQRLEAQKRY